MHLQFEPCKHWFRFYLVGIHKFFLRMLAPKRQKFMADNKSVANTTYQSQNQLGLRLLLARKRKWTKWDSGWQQPEIRDCHAHRDLSSQQHLGSSCRTRQVNRVLSRQSAELQLDELKSSGLYVHNIAAWCSYTAKVDGQCFPGNSCDCPNKPICSVTADLRTTAGVKPLVKL